MEFVKDYVHQEKWTSTLDKLNPITIFDLICRPDDIHVIAAKAYLMFGREKKGPQILQYVNCGLRRQLKDLFWYEQISELGLNELEYVNFIMDQCRKVIHV